MGFGLDYHVFLLSRIIELRRSGCNDRASIVRGLAHTGRIITAAGARRCVRHYKLCAALTQAVTFVLLQALSWRWPFWDSCLHTSLLFRS